MIGRALAVRAAGQPGAIDQAQIITRLQRDVIGQAGVIVRTIILRVGKAREQRIDERRIGVALERAPVDVLHHHDPHGLDRTNTRKTEEAIKTAREGSRNKPSR